MQDCASPLPFPLSPPSPQFLWRQQLCKRCSLHLVYRPAVVYREFRTNVRLQCALSSSLNRHSTHGTGAYLTGYLPGVTARHIHVSTPAAPGSSWQLLAVPVSSWQLLGPPGSSWQLPWECVYVCVLEFAGVMLCNACVCGGGCWGDALRCVCGVWCVVYVKTPILG